MYGVLALLAISTLDMLTFSANLSIATFKMQKDCMDRQSLTSKKSELMSKSYTTVFWLSLQMANHIFMYISSLLT